MARINLLPWREEQRAEQAKKFGVSALLTAIIGAGIVYGGVHHANQKIDHQQARNNYLQNEIDKLKKDLKEIEELESTKANLLARMDIIQQLQTRRPQSMKQNKDILAFEGKADSNARVSTLMRNLGSSDWFKQPGLELIESQDKDSGISSFKLRLSQSVAPATAENDK